MHCYFVLAGDPKTPVLYHVERVRDGKSFITRTVQARQKGRCIFTTTLSFMRESSGGQKTVDHAWDMPDSATEKLNELLNDDEGDDDLEDRKLGVERSGPFITKKMPIQNSKSSTTLTLRCHRLTGFLLSEFTLSPPEEDPPMDQVSWSNIPRSWSSSTSLCSCLYVR